MPLSYWQVNGAVDKTCTLKSRLRASIQSQILTVKCKAMVSAMVRNSNTLTCLRISSLSFLAPCRRYASIYVPGRRQLQQSEARREGSERC